MWSSKVDFLKAQVQVVVILVIAYVGNNWPQSYHRNENHDPTMFWVMNLALVIAGLVTLKHDANASSRGVQLLSRPQTEEWKGWMQWAFIMYHYYRVYYVYNEIRVFVSAYVWMTGFGNFLYFEKKQDFSLERIISMWLRINYFPLLLSFCLGVPLELYYVVPLHTAGFFITMATCYVSSLLKQCKGMNYWASNGWAILLCLMVHIAFYETPAVNFLKVFSDEYHFRFQADKYTAWVGILSGYFWQQFKAYMQWVYASPQQDSSQKAAMWGQRIAGVFLIWLWYHGFGYISDKFKYNPMHPYIFWIPVAGWLMIRNSSKYLCELHATAMEFFGRITLETYVLQFHVFMCQDVQHIPVVIPGAVADGPLLLKTANMLLCGSVFVPLALWARKVTITTQTSVVDLIEELRGKKKASDNTYSKVPTKQEKASLADNGESSDPSKSIKTESV
mmetsp:Transcript_44804/g.66479  ORF Transcript_44804/g.66479 Transcript_44804/m.66479 type:complete len:448 (-) Transcript_44804:62-1405(-)|eukprot:CAMPEP_0194046444 /NCGR_PEP_ID=MMETSP0009_2-20130614/21111_1 /TAXON_ID=210454 /ORGANISM="Grammatophora oceanica, Strain CCMP 410" /LENGTH=447 /DNA_ID=CAMNT_0038691733 /DNA_START=60 /DNA_END=1403 /DNA_ORIENTATION=-